MNQIGQTVGVRVHPSCFLGFGLCLQIRTTASKRLASCPAAISPKSGLVDNFPLHGPQQFDIYSVHTYQPFGDLSLCMEYVS